MSGILKLGGTTLGTENNGTIDLEFHSTSQDFTLKAVDAPIVGANYSTEDNLDSGQLAIYNGATKLWGINESGWTLNPNIPSFNAHSSYGNWYGTVGVLPFDLATINQGGHYNTSSYTFTAPISGKYIIFVKLLTQGSGGQTYLRKNGTDILRIAHTSTASTYYDHPGSTALIEMSAGDYITVYLGSVYNGDDLYLGGDPNPYSWWGGYLLG